MHSQMQCQCYTILHLSLVAQSCLTLWHHALEHTRLPCPSPTPEVYSHSCTLSRQCHPTISPSVIPFSSSLQSFPPSGSFQMSQFFTSGGQSTEVSATTLVLPMNIQDWCPLGWTGWIFLKSKGLSRLFSSTTIQKHQFFGTLGHNIYTDTEIWDVDILMLNRPIFLPQLVSSFTNGFKQNKQQRGTGEPGQPSI